MTLIKTAITLMAMNPLFAIPGMNTALPGQAFVGTLNLTKRSVLDDVYDDDEWIVMTSEGEQTTENPVYDGNFAVFVDAPVLKTSHVKKGHNRENIADHIVHIARPNENDVVIPDVRDSNDTKMWKSVSQKHENGSIIHKIEIVLVHSDLVGKNELHNVGEVDETNDFQDDFKQDKKGNQTENADNKNGTRIVESVMPYKYRTEEGISEGNMSVGMLRSNESILNEGSDMCLQQCHSQCSSSKWDTPVKWQNTTEEQKKENFGRTDYKQRLGSSEKLTLEDICLSETCVLKAADILKRMNTSIDPCDDFYEFSCSRFLSKGLHDSDASWSAYSEIESDILQRAKHLLDAPVTSSDSLHAVTLKAFYAKCATTSAPSFFNEFIAQFGGWPKPHDLTWNFSSLSWKNVAYRWTYGSVIEHNLIMVNLTYFNKTSKWFLNLDVPPFVFIALKTNESVVLDRVKYEITTLAQSLKISEHDMERTSQYELFLMLSAIKCANATIKNTTAGFYTLRELKIKFSHLEIIVDLPKLLETAAEVDDDELIHVSNVKYLERINDLIRDTPVRVQMNHLVLTAFRLAAALLTHSADDDEDEFCVKMTWKLFPRFLGNLYGSKFVANGSVEGVLNIVGELRDRISKSVDGAEWLDEIGRRRVLNRIHSLDIFVAEQDVDINDIRHISDVFVKFQHSSFVTYVSTGISNIKNQIFKFLGKNVAKSLPSFMSNVLNSVAYQVNAFYFSENIMVPPSLFHETLYNKEFPSYVNYASVGFIFGHEITHGVIDGSDISNLSSYVRKESCVVGQFNGFQDQGLPVDGATTKDENIADLGGFREAYKTYVDHIRGKRSDERLPGLVNFNAKQMFWITAASNWCARTEAAMKKDQVHAPTQHRINGQLANTAEFSKDFNCPVGSRMNPKTKCTLW